MLLSALERALAAAGVERHGAGLRVLVACSGGADSVALAVSTVELLGAARVVLGHVDHGLRAGSETDAEWVRALAERLGTRAVIERVAPRGDGEAELRRLRYEALESQAIAADASLILTAHTADDQAETVLIALLRSGRLDALSGIRPRRGSIVRPWLGVSRAELRAYLVRRGFAWREDPSNVEPRYLRNRIRKELLPLLERRYRAGIAPRLARLAATLQRGGALPGRTSGSPQGPSPATDPPASGPTSSARLPSPASSARLPGLPAEAEPEAEAEAVPDAAALARWRDGALELRAEHGPVELPTDRWSAVFDRAIYPVLEIRAPRPGDRIQPIGLAGSKKLQDVLVDAKVPRALRAALRVVAIPSGEVVWVPGISRGRGALVGLATQEIWLATCRAPPSASISTQRSRAT